MIEKIPYQYLSVSGDVIDSVYLSDETEEIAVRKLLESFSISTTPLVSIMGYRVQPRIGYSDFVVVILSHCGEAQLCYMYDSTPHCKLCGSPVSDYAELE